MRHLVGLHHRSLNLNRGNAAGAPSFTGAQGLSGVLVRAGHVIDEAQTTLSRFNASSSPTLAGSCVMGTFDPGDASAINRVIEELAVEMLRFRSAVELVGDGIMRAKHNAELGSLLDEQEARARQLANAGVMPPFKAIVRASTARAAGVRVATLSPRCDRRMGWRVWEAAAWNTQGKLANQATCAREEENLQTGISIEELWMVDYPNDQQKLARYLQRAN